MTEPMPVTAAPAGTPNLNKALAAFQAEMPRLERDRSVEVETKGDKANYSYSYATLANASAIAMPLLGKHGLAFSAFPGTGPDGKMSMAYFLLHESGEERSGSFPLSAEGGIQMLGGRITYIRRYCLMAVTGLVADEDDDAAVAQAQDEANGGTAQRSRQGSRPTAATTKPRKAAPVTAPEPSRAAPAEPPGRAPVPGATGSAPGAASLPNDDRKLEQRQLARIQILMGELNYGGDHNRTIRLNLISKIVRRSVDTTNDLNRTEAEAVIARLVARVKEVEAEKAQAKKAAPSAAQTAQRSRRESIVGVPDENAQAPWEPSPGELTDEHGRKLP